MRIKNIIIITLIIGILLLVKYFFFPSMSSQQDAKPGKPGAGMPPSNVTAYILKVEKLSNEVYASGTIIANEEVQLQSELSGKILQINFQEGSKVTKGQLLVKINDADLQANYKKLQLQYSLADQKLQREKQLLAINGISQEEFAGNLSIEKIDNSKLKEYIGWRKDYYHKMKVEDRPKGHKINPADKTLLWEETLARTIIKFATEKGYRGKSPLPTYRYKVENKIVRPAFTVTEYWDVIRAMRRRIKEAFNDPERRYTRELLRDYVLILANSGMRVGEANNLKERDVEEFKDEHGNKNYMFNVKGKTGKRVVIPSTNTVRYIERVFERNKIRKDLLAQGTVRKVRSPQRKEDNIADWFFCMYDGNKIITLIDQFRDLLKSIGLEKNRYGETFSLYSLRHFYAMKMIRKNTVGIFDLARNMGTSVEIIEGYYGKGATSLFLATRLGGGGKKKEVESDKAKTEE